MPLSFVVTRTRRRPCAKRPLGPSLGAENTMAAPRTALPFSSRTVTANGTTKRDPTTVDSPEAAPAATLLGAPARLTSLYAAGAAPPDTVAVTVNAPAVLFATSGGELAVPSGPVIAVATAAPPRKLAPAPPSDGVMLKLTLA